MSFSTKAEHFRTIDHGMKYRALWVVKLKERGTRDRLFDVQHAQPRGEIDCTSVEHAKLPFPTPASLLPRRVSMPRREWMQFKTKNGLPLR